MSRFAGKKPVTVTFGAHERMARHVQGGSFLMLALGYFIAGLPCPSGAHSKFASLLLRTGVRKPVCFCLASSRFAGGSDCVLCLYLMTVELQPFSDNEEGSK